MVGFDSENANEPSKSVRSPDEGLDTGLACLQMLLAFHEISVDPKQIAHDLSPEGANLSNEDIVRAARRYELKSREVKTSLKKLERSPLPAIVPCKDGTFFILAKVANGRALIQRPGFGPETLELHELDSVWNKKLILGSRRAKSITEEMKFGLAWFLPVLLTYKRLFAEVLTASFFLQLFGLVTPLFFQVVIDKVLVHRGVTTLDVLIIGLLSLTFFEAILGYLRTYIFAHTTSRVDARLGSKLFSHLISLPVSYFENRPTGQTVARVRELENVRDFITGNALTVVLDLFFGLLFFWVMYIFSPILTFVVACSIPIYVIISLLITPTLRKRVEDKFQRGAVNQSFLVESVSGAETLKAMAVEPQMRRRWDENLAAYVTASFKTVSLGAAGSQMVQFVNKAVTALLLFFGAKLAMAGELTVGQLVAFNMLAGQVSQPIMRLAQLWQDFQQFRISIDKLGDVLNAKPEIAGASVPENLPPLTGAIDFKDVRFRYGPDLPEVLKGVSIDVKAGQMVGFVGRSGSGKSTITKLIQRLYVPERGEVSIDGINTALMQPAWLRRQIGVVLQENILFNRPLRENIALANPTFPMERIVEAAKLAGAHDFILQLPHGYDTMIEERGSNLSGGQRQRIAIARALISDPRILIFDEATSALDYESEKIIQANMNKIAEGRTVIVVAHRLSAVKDADLIHVMDQGVIVETGTHTSLLGQGGVYSTLFGEAS